MNTVSMPLSLGYIKATAYADPGIRSAADIQICSFRGSDTASEIIHALFTQGPPDILAFSSVRLEPVSLRRESREVYRQLQTRRLDSLWVGRTWPIRQSDCAGSFRRLT